MCCGQNKPFFRLLGETLQGHYDDGTTFYCEHTSHHSPISNFWRTQTAYTNYQATMRLLERWEQTSLSLAFVDVIT